MKTILEEVAEYLVENVPTHMLSGELKCYSCLCWLLEQAGKSALSCGLIMTQTAGTDSFDFCCVGSEFIVVSPDMSKFYGFFINRDDPFGNVTP